MRSRIPALLLLVVLAGCGADEGTPLTPPEAAVAPAGPAATPSPTPTPAPDSLPAPDTPLPRSADGLADALATAGARGPMQFIPATWSAYGLGGDVRDPRDAILGAANYLHASGSPGNDRRAVFAYNHSGHYVSAVLRYAARIRRDPRAFYAYYAWQVYVRTPGGARRITGPGRAAP